MFERPATLPFKAPFRVLHAEAKRHILEGDSRSSTDYPWYRQAVADYLGIALPAGATPQNTQVYNAGYPGHTVAQNATDIELQRGFDYDPQGYAIFLPGGNDTGAAGTVGTFDGTVAGEPWVQPTDIGLDYANTAGSTFIQAVDHRVRKWLAHYRNYRARAGLTGSEAEAQENDKIRAVSKPKLVLCTDLPQARYTADNPFSLTENHLRKRAAIIEVGVRNRVHTVDTMLAMPIDMPLEIAASGRYPGNGNTGTNTTNNQGVLMMDALHPNEHGNYILAGLLLAGAGA